MVGISGEAGLGEKRAGRVLSSGGELAQWALSGLLGVEAAEKKMAGRSLSTASDRVGRGGSWLLLSSDGATMMLVFVLTLFPPLCPPGEGLSQAEKRIRQSLRTVWVKMGTNTTAGHVDKATASGVTVILRRSLLYPEDMKTAELGRKAGLSVSEVCKLSCMGTEYGMLRLAAQL